MPGHSLHFNKKLGRWTVFHGKSFDDTEFNLQDLYIQFQILGSKNAPRYFKVGGIGNDLDLKYIALVEAGILEALQRWHPENPPAKPADVYYPTEVFDYDQITELLNALNIELASHQNADGTPGHTYTEQPLPRSWQVSPNDISPEYDEWVVARVEEFRNELKNKPKVTMKPDPQPPKQNDPIKYVGSILIQILNMLPRTP